MGFTFDMFTLYAAKRLGWAIEELEVAYKARSWGRSKLAANPWVRIKISLNAFAKMFSIRAGRYGPMDGKP